MRQRISHGRRKIPVHKRNGMVEAVVDQVRTGKMVTKFALTEAPLCGHSPKR